MDSAVLDRPEADTTELGDYEPPCSLSMPTTAILLLMGAEPPPCPNPAKWTGFTPCCGIAALVCEPHRNDHLSFFCPCGRRFPDLINWSRL